ncbi:MAG: nuclear transport factor 2 family protein, partial [Comamonadaceae bacterium]
TFVGVDAIQAFLAEAAARYSATTVPIAVERKDGVQVVLTTVSGNFPGSPIALAYRFRLERGLIAALEIAP